MSGRWKFSIFAVLMYGVTLGVAYRHDQRQDIHGPTASFCYRGVMPSVCIGCTLQPGVLNLEWGPPEFRMTVHSFGVPGLTAGWLMNSAGVCTDAEATAYGEGLAARESTP